MSDLEVAERAALAAGEVLLGWYGREPEGLGSKSSDIDMVSDADREAERAIEEILAAERPDDGLLGEEGARREATSGRRWICDPLDGTTNFLHGFPVWCVSVALEDEQGLAVGVVHDPLRDETFRAARGAGAELGGRPLRVREPRPLRRALVATGFVYDPMRRAAQAGVIRRLLPRVRDIRRAGAAALDLAWVAAGRLDAFYERGLNRWDFAAGALLVTEAGGVAGELAGEPPGLIAASSQELFDELAAVVGPP